MLTSRSAAPDQLRLRYNHKTHNTPARHYYYPPYVASQKKDSKVKVKKDQRTTLHSTAQHSSQNYTFNKECKETLRQTYDQNVDQCLNLAEFHKNQSLALKKRNENLEHKVKFQNLELEKLKLEMCQIKQNLSNTMNIRTRQFNELLQLNHNLEGRSQIQQRQIDSLRQKILKLRDFRPSTEPILHFEDVSISKNSDPNEISRRKEYILHYQAITSDIPQELSYIPHSYGQSCWRDQSDTQMKEKYIRQLRRLEQEVSVLKENGLLVQVLEKQVQNKNQCIDFLRNQLQIVQTNSTQLLLVIESLERKMEQIENKTHHGQNKRRHKAVSSFHTFSDSKY